MNRIRLTVNGEAVDAQVEPRVHLADFLRERRRLTGLHLGCEQGVCGACTVLLDGAPARSCITLAVACDGADITSIEGLDADALTGELRAAFNRRHALQCGYCTPGMLVMSRDIVRRLPQADRAQVRHELSGNLCRCTGYQGIVDAICDVLEARRGSAAPDAGTCKMGPAGSGHGTAQTLEEQDPGAVTSAEAVSSVMTAALQEPGGELPETPQVVESFDLPDPPEKVWEIMGDVQRVARCMPGAELQPPPAGYDVGGRLRVKLGPMAAAFEGAAQYERDAEAQAATLSGLGADARSGTRARGRLAYRLTPMEDGAGTRVDVELTYALSGPLAQFARGALVRDLVRRLIEVFKENLKAQTAGDFVDPPSNAALEGGALLRGALVATLARWMSALAFWRRGKE